MSAETFHDVQTDIEQVSEHLAQKFYKHYDDMDYDKMYIARTVGPDLGRMIDHLMEENKKLKEERDLFEVEFHKTLEHQANDCEEYEKQIEELKRCLDNEAGHHRMYEKNCKKLKEDAGDTARYWECMMDFLGNPDGPTQEYVQEWAKDEGLSKLDTEDLLNNFG